MTNPPIDTVVSVEVPELIRFRYRLAGPAQRAVAHGADLALLVVIAAVIWAATGLVTMPVAYFLGDTRGVANARTGLLLLCLFFLQWGYFTVFEALWHGQTPGKRALGLRVVKVGGEPIGFIDAALRNLLRSADGLPFGYALGVLVQSFDPQFRRLGDLVAGTMVVVEDRASVAEPVLISPPTVAELSVLPAHAVLSPEEFRAIETFLRRVSALGPALAAEIASSVAPALAKKYGFPYTDTDPVRLLGLLYLRAGPVRKGFSAP